MHSPSSRTRSHESPEKHLRYQAYAGANAQIGGGESAGTLPGRRFTGEALREIAFPLGGIGTGTVSLGGYGQLRVWEIFNRPAMGARLPFTFACMRLAGGGLAKPPSAPGAATLPVQPRWRRARRPGPALIPRGDLHRRVPAWRNRSPTCFLFRFRRGFRSDDSLMWTHHAARPCSYRFYRERRPGWSWRQRFHDEPAGARR
jgi:hypothetical protein